MDSERVRIVSDGTPQGTKVLDTDGKPFDACITKVEWSIEADNVGVARLTLWNVEIDAAAELRD